MTRDAASGAVLTREPPQPAGALHSRLVQRLRRRYADELPLLPPGTPDAASMGETLQRLRARGHATGAALRILRQLVMERLVVLDCEQDAPLAAVTGVVTALAELALDVACTEAFEQLDARHGAPRTAAGERAQLWVVGMGKLGARELNVSSDIDLIYIYDADGETAGRDGGAGSISVHEYFIRAVRLISTLIGDVTEHGFVFRVDLALRPGNPARTHVAGLPTDGRLSLERVATITSGAPARAFGLYGRKGVIRVGADADLAAVDLNKTARLSAAALHSRGKVSAYEGMEVKGVPVMTFVRGHMVARDGEVLAEKGWGQLVRPDMPAPAPRNLNTTMRAVLEPGRAPWG